MRLLAFCLLLLLSLPAHAAGDDIPEHIQGKWVSVGEACDAVGAPVVVSATTLVYADGTLSEVYFSPEDNAIRLPNEGTDYQYIADSDRLIFQPEGIALAMQRCAEPVDATERRCGWLANLTPGNWWLVDRDRTWILSAQGDDNAATIAVMDRVPGFDAAQFISTGSYYGYGCTCMTVATDTAQSRIRAINSSKRLPLATCQTDKSLPPLSDW